MAGLDLAELFESDTDAKAYEIHVVAQDRDGNFVDVNLGLDQRMAQYYKEHQNLPELDAQKLKADYPDKFPGQPEEGVTYVDYEAFKEAVRSDYNQAMGDAGASLVTMRAEAGVGDNSYAFEHVEDITDPNALDWESTHRWLDGLTHYGDDEMQATASDALQRLEDSGSMAQKVAVFNFEVVKPETPWHEVPEQFDFSEYRIDETVGGTGMEIKPQ
ncbi:MAG: hypothetical protein ACRBCK_09080 [Alphaproteobacteria bacterium]